MQLSSASQSYINIVDTDAIIGYAAGKLFSLFCHQDPSILLQIDGKYLLLCPRCCGLHLGFLISLIFFSAGQVKRSRFAGPIPFVMVLGGFLWLALDWTLGQTSFYQASTLSRFGSGIAAGSSFSVLYLVYFRNYLKPTEHSALFTVRSLLGTICLALVVSWVLFLIKSWRFITISMVVVFLINLLLVCYAVFQRLRSLLKINLKMNMP